MATIQQDPLIQVDIMFDLISMVVVDPCKIVHVGVDPLTNGIQKILNSKPFNDVMGFVNKSVKITAKEVIRVPDTYSWWMPIATRNPEFTCTAPGDIAFRVKAHHPERDNRLEEKSTGKHWCFNGTMLPGQALEVQTFAVAKSSSKTPIVEEGVAAHQDGSR